MIFTIHILSSAMLALGLYPFLGFYPSVLIFFGGWTVDFDHYIWYIFKYRRFNMFECNRFFTADAKENGSKHFRGTFLPFHTIEFMVLMVILSIWSKFFMYFSIGLAFHFSLDLISFLFIEKDFPVRHSIIYWYIKTRNKI